MTLKVPIWIGPVPMLPSQGVDQGGVPIWMSAPSGGVIPPPPQTGFPHGGQYMLVSTTRMFVRFGWAWGMN